MQFKFRVNILLTSKTIMRTANVAKFKRQMIIELNVHFLEPKFLTINKLFYELLMVINFTININFHKFYKQNYNLNLSDDWR